MSSIYGYCRISRKRQNIDSQERNILREYPEAIIVKEAYTGTKFDGRKGFEQLYKTAKAGDTIVFDSVSRMSRNAEEGFKQYQDFLSSGIELVFLKEPHINTSTYKEAISKQIEISAVGDEATDILIKAITEGINGYMLKLAEKQIYLAFQQAEKEVQDLHQRTKEGIETARLAGKQIGLKKGTKTVIKKKEPSKELIRKYSKDFDGTLKDTECMKLIGIARNTYYKYKAELKAGI